MHNLNKYLYIILFAITILSFTMCDNTIKTETVKNIPINNNWQFRQVGTLNWKKANVPGCIHTDLLNNKLIPNPYFADNEKKLQWIETEKWEYRCSFKIDSSISSLSNLKLVFEGLDTYADIFLNDIKISSVNNMFRKWEYDIKNLIKENNSLHIVFHPAIISDSLKAEELRYKLPDNRVFTRKAPYQYGWDWGPRFVTCGIWRPVYIQGWNNFKTEDIHISCTDIIDKATLSAEFQIKSEVNQYLSITISDNETELVYSNYKIDLIAGENRFGWEFEIKNPELWWTKGLGKPKLYNLKIEIESDYYKQSLNKTIGLRTIQLIQRPDSAGKSFEFVLNGTPVFIKGANYIPMDNFLPEISKSRYEELISDAADANMNMLRVWGGGIYEDDEFYKLCDENGILVWQDFMFACNMYPGDIDFINNVKEEAKQNIIRLREHPCIALWCGNNEVDNAWKDWGWQKQFNYSSSDSSEIYSNYKKLFNSILPKLTNLYSPEISYWPTSPQWGWGHEQSNTEGDSHYWGVWWGMKPFDSYEDNVGRFMSEYGFQAFPDIKTIEQFTDINDRNIYSNAILNHQKHPTGNETIIEYMTREYPSVEDFSSFVYLSQLVQAEGITKAIEAHRIAKPYCMGTLYWQLNDCWPAISWSSIDYYNRKKALYYFSKKAYKKIILSTEINNDSLSVFVISDSINSLDAKLIFNFLNFSGENLITDTSKITIAGNSSKIYTLYNLDTIINDSLKSSYFANIQLISNGNIVSETNKFLCKAKDLMLAKSNIKIKANKIEGGYKINLTATNLTKNLFIYLDKSDVKFSDNYFDLLPKKPKIIIIYTDREIPDIESRIKFMSLNSLVNQSINEDKN